MKIVYTWQYLLLLRTYFIEIKLVFLNKKYLKNWTIGLTAHMFICLYVYIFIWLLAHLSNCLADYLSTCLQVITTNLLICLRFFYFLLCYPPICLPAFQYTCQFVYLFIITYHLLTSRRRSFFDDSMLFDFMFARRFKPFWIDLV